MPLVSIVVPAYRSGATIAAALDALERQTFRDFEIVVVESGGDTHARNRANIRWIGVGERLLPQDARNLGVTHARGELLAFTDPDIYAEPRWLELLVDAWRRHGDVVVGATACHGSRLLDFGYHLCKFSKWLPGSPEGEVDNAPSGNMLVSRADFERAGAFPRALFVGDVELSRRLRDAGLRLRLEPRAIAAHHHLYTLRAFCRERFERGVSYGTLRSAWFSRPRRILMAAASILPVRLVTNVAHVARHAARAGVRAKFLAVLPIVVLGYACTLAGEATAFVRATFTKSRRI